MTTIRNTWDADIAIDAVLAERLLTRQFPQFAPHRLTLLGVGWDNVAFLLYDGIVFRFPRRRAMVRLMEQDELTIEERARLGEILRETEPS